MKRIIFLWLFCLSAVASFSQATEICDDGIDNDGDGFIDCYDPDCSNFGKCNGTFLGNDVLCQAKPIEFPKFTIQVDFKSPDNTTNNLARVAIGDLDRDGIPEIVTMNRYSKQLFVLNGNGGSIKHSVTVPFEPQWEVAIANLDNDNCAEIFTFGVESGKTYLYSYNCSLTTQLWKREIQGDPINFGLADFNGDGKVELYAKDEIFDAKTGVRLVQSNNWSTLNGGPVAVDMEGSSDLELVIGCIIYSVNLGNGTADNGSLTELHRAPNYFLRNEYNATSVADYNQDGFLDVLATGSTSGSSPRNTTIFFWDVHNNPSGNAVTFFDNTAGAYLPNGWSNGTGRLNISDLDGDKKLNVSYVSGKFLYALDENLNLKWRVVINEETSGYTGCTLFDFNGDGKSEIVYRDERFIYIINGTDGTIFTQQTCVSRTNREYPIVADVDADGSTEICVPCITNDGAGMDFSNFGSDAFLKAPSQIRVYKSASEPWVPARRVWNQHGYFNVNVNDDLTIPKIQQKHHLVFSTGSCTQGPNRPLNTFLNQSPYLNSQGCPTYASPDLAHVPNSLVVNAPTCPNTNFTISFKITNLGDVALDGTVPVSFYNGDPTKAGAIKLGTMNVTLTNLKTSDIFSITNATINGPGSLFTLYIVLNDAGTQTSPISLPNTNFVECNYDNIISVVVRPNPVTITAQKVADNLKCSGSATPDNGAVRAFIPVGATQNTSDYHFYWFNGPKSAVTGTPNYTGATYSGLAAGTYSVFGVHKTANCNSDTVSVVVGEIEKTINVDVVLINGVTDCKNPNGQLKAIVNNGTDPVSNFNYVWFEAPTAGGGPQVGVNNIATDLKPLTTYAVRVTDKVTGCQNAGSLLVPSNVDIPVVSTTQSNILCSSSNSGSVTATVGGATTGFKFEWYKGSNIKPSPDFTGSNYTSLTAGNYTVVATRIATNCVSSPVTIAITQTTKPVVSASVTSDQTSCDATRPNGAATSSATGGSGTYSTEWFKGQNTLPANQFATSASVTSLAVGTYTVKVTDTNTGCFDTKEVTVTLNVGPAPVISATVTDQTQCVPYNGSITAGISTGNVSDYTFSWYNGTSVKATPDYTDTDNVLSGVPAGKYTVKAVNNLTFCPAAAKTFTVLDLSPTISITLNSSITIYPTDCNSANGEMTVDVSSPGNTLGFKIEWFYGKAPFAASSIKTDNVLSSSTAAGLKSGIYTVIATDLNSGCFSSKSFNLPFIGSPTVDFVAKTDITKCVPDNDGNVEVQLVLSPAAPTIGLSDFTILVYRGTNDLNSSVTDGLELMQGSAAPSSFYTTPSTLTADSYTFVAVGIAGQFQDCRSVPLTVEVIKNTSDPVIDGNPTIVNNTNCTPALVNGSITATADMTSTFDWFNGQAVKASPDFTGATYGSLAPGFYTVRATVTDPTNAGCTSVATFSIADNPDNVTIASAGLTIQDITACNLASGAILTDGSAAITAITENGSPGTLSDYHFDWSNNAGTSLQSGASANLTNLAIGVYFVKATNNTSGCFTELEFDIEDKTMGSPTVALISFDKPERCVNPRDGQLTVVASGGTGSPTYSYEWFSGTAPSGTVIGNSATLNGLPFTAITAPSPQYTIKAINNNNHCWATDTYALPSLVNEVIITASSSSPITSCVTDNGVVFGTVVNDISTEYGYDWSIGATAKTTPDYSGKQVNNLGIGSYTLVATDLLDNFCVSKPKTVALDDMRMTPLVAAAMSSPLTNCDLVKANGVATASVNGNIVNYTFDWYTGTTASGVPFFSGAEAGGLQDQTYTIVATDRITGCTGATQVTVTKNLIPVPNPQIVVLSNVTSCISDNGEMTASVNGNTSDYIFNWYVGNAPKATIDYTGEYIDELSVGLYTVVATSRITGCVSGPDTDQIIEEKVVPDFDFKVIPASCEATNGSASVLITNEVEIASIVWNANGTQVFGPNLTQILAGTYTVTVTTILGCVTSKEVTITTDIRPFNGVSRNGDGKNDIFYINCIDNFPGNNVKIFNRAGTKVYEDDNYDNIDIYFDGKSNKGISPMGVNLPDGTYYYIIDKRDGSKPIAGYLELVN